MPNLTKGVVVRGVRPNGKLFESEELDVSDNLTEASVNSFEGATEDDLKRLSDKLEDGNTPYTQVAYTTVEKIVQKGGRVQKAERKSNTYHCQIFGVPRKDAQNLFSNKITRP
jgi:hypothetical protein